MRIYAQYFMCPNLKRQCELIRLSPCYLQIFKEEDWVLLPRRFWINSIIDFQGAPEQQILVQWKEGGAKALHVKMS